MNLALLATLIYLTVDRHLTTSNRSRFVTMMTLKYVIRNNVAVVEWTCDGKWLSFSQENGTHTPCITFIIDPQEENGINLFIVMRCPVVLT